MKKEVYDKLNETLTSLEVVINGGSGSGNFGHAGREGKRGGSAKSGIKTHSKTYKWADESYEATTAEYTAEPDVLIIKSGDQVGYLDNYPSDSEVAYALHNRKLKDLADFAEDGDLIREHLDAIDGKQSSYESKKSDRELKKLKKDIRKIKEDMAGITDLKKYIKTSQKAIDSTKKGIDTFTSLLGQGYDDSMLQRKIDENKKILRTLQESHEAKLAELDRKYRELDAQNNGVKFENGGKGSGNFGHSGREGKVGGSSTEKCRFAKSFQSFVAEEDSLTDGEFSKDLDAIQKEFSDMGLNLDKITITTDYDELPTKVKNTQDKTGQAFARKDGRGMVYLEDGNLTDYGWGEDNSYKPGLSLDKQPYNTSTKPLSVLRHELGHLVHDSIYLKSRIRKTTSAPLSTFETEKFCHKLVEKALGQDFSNGFKSEMSVYGTKNWKEYIAESFANPNFSTHTRKIYDYCVSELKRLNAKENENNSIKKEDEWRELCIGYVVKGRKVKSTNGGRGSGNFGHFGRKGKVGGSGKSDSYNLEVEDDGPKNVADTHEELRNITDWKNHELSNVIPYFGDFKNTEKVQEYLRGGDDAPISNIAMASDCVRTMKEKMARTEFPEDTILYRGMMIRNDRMDRVENNGFSYPGFQSTSLVGNDASRIIQEYKESGNYDPQFYTPVLLKIHAKKGQHFAASYMDVEHEIVLPPNIRMNVKNKAQTSLGMLYEVDYDEE